MAEFGQTGKWLILPVKLCVAFVGAYYIFVGFFHMGSILFNGIPTLLTINRSGTLFGSEPSIDLIEQIPESGMYPVVPWMAQLYLLQLGIICLAGLLSLCIMLCSFSGLAKMLYYTTMAYGFVWLVTHAGLLYCYQRNILLDFIPSFRGQREHQVLIFGELTWPNSFWYQFAAQILFTLWMVYLVADLYYSYYLILKSGGSGWEMLPAEDLPGWERYQANLEKQRRANDIDDVEGGMPDFNDLSPEQLQQLLQMMQQQGAMGGPMMGGPGGMMGGPGGMMGGPGGMMGGPMRPPMIGGGPMMGQGGPMMGPGGRPVNPMMMMNQGGPRGGQ